MHTSQLLRHLAQPRLATTLLIAALIALTAPGVAPHRVLAQDGNPDVPEDPAAQVETLALAAHLQNLRLTSYTAWIGGGLGTPGSAPRRSPLAERFDNRTLDGFAGDDDVDLGTLERPVLLNFWASWCPPCRAEFPHLTAITAAPDDYAFDVIFVNTSDTERDAREFLAGYPATITTAIDENGRFALRAGIETLPTSLLLDHDGTVLAAHVGLITPTVSAFLDAVARHPGAGIFIAADHMVDPPGAVLAPISVQDTEPLASGDTVQGMIDADVVQHAYRIDGNAGDRLTVTLAAGGGDLDPYLVLMTADGERLTEHDDITPGDNPDARISIPLPADGTYIIVATRFLETEGMSAGPFELSVTLTPAVGTAPPVPQTSTPDARIRGAATGPSITRPPDAPSPVPDPQPDDRRLRYGDTVSGMIDDQQHAQRWTFEGRTGDVVDIVMQRTVDEDGGLDGFLILEGPDGNTLLEVDDANNNVMPSIRGYALPANGIYTIVATRFSFASGFSTGEYTLTLSRTNSRPQTSGGPGPTWTPPDGIRWLSYNEAAQGSIDADNVDDWYSFRGHSGDAVTVHMTARTEAFDPFLILTDSSGHELARDDDSGGQRNAAIAVELPDTATYLVRATRYGFANGPSSGAYELTVASDGSVSNTVHADLPALAYGDSVTGTLTLEQPVARYNFDGHSRDVVTLRAMGTDELTPALILRGPDGDVLVDDRQTATASGSTLLRYPLPADGRYMVEIVPQGLASSGDFRLLLLGREVAPLDAGAFVPAPDLGLELVLIWNAPVDLDLEFLPTGGVPREGEPSVPDATRANDFCQNVTPTPVERITWAADSTIAGQYKAAIAYRANCTGHDDPVRFILVIASRGEVIDITGGTLAREGDRYSTPVILRD